MLFLVKRLFLFVVLSVNVWPILAQSRADIFEEADIHFADGDYSLCIDSFLELLKKDSLNCNLNYIVGSCLFNLPGRRKESLPYFEKAVKKVSEHYSEGSFSEKKAPIEAVFYYAQVLMVYNRLAEAKDNFLKFRKLLDVLDVASIDYVDQLIRSCDNATALQEKKVAFTSSKLPFPINSTEPVFKSVFNKNEDYVVFLSKREGRLAFLCSKKSNGNWQEPSNITAQLDVNDKFDLCSISADGLRLYLSKFEAKGSSLYMATFDGVNWGKCSKMSKPINSSYDQTYASESVDGQLLFFSSNRRGGLGGLDLYVSKLKSNGQWNSPVNLGKSINTPLNEEAPNLSVDNNTLYFSSQGHYNIGGYDVFTSTKLGENLWSEPQNIGYPLNTTDDDLSFVPSSEQGRAYLTDYSGDVGVVVQIDTRAKQEKQFNLLGTLAFSDDSKVSEKVAISLLSENGDTLSRLTPSSTGKYQVQVKPGSYSVCFSATGYSSILKPVIVSSDSQVTDFVVDAILQPIKVTSGEFVSIRNLFFDFNSALLTRDDSTLLERLSRIMLDYNSLAIEIEAHADSKGDRLYNKELSILRAKSVADFLVSRGVSASRMITIGAGDAVAIARNTNPDGTDSPEGRSYNRRAELRIINAGNVRVVNEDVAIPENLRVVNSNEYSICLAQKNDGSKVDWPSGIDLNQVSNVSREGNFYYIYGAPSSKSEALVQLAKISNLVSGAFIIPRSYLQMSVGASELVNTCRYAIQVGAFRTTIPSSTFAVLKKTVFVVGLDGITRYIYGDYASFAQAASALNEIKMKGFPDAFVVSLTKNNKPVNSNYDIGYTVQVFASFVHLKDSNFPSLSNVKESKGSDGYLRYTVGHFDTFKDASAYLREIKQNGYQNAFVRRVSEISGY